MPTETTLPAEKVALEPCPWCGPDGKIENWASRPRDRDHDVWCVFCHKCLCEGPEALTEAESARLWNLRAAAQPTPASGEREQGAPERLNINICVKCGVSNVGLNDCRSCGTPPNLSETTEYVRADKHAKLLSTLRYALQALECGGFAPAGNVRELAGSLRAALHPDN